MHKKLELTGYTNDRITVIQRARIIANITYWICRCSCDGMYFIAPGKGINAQKIKSCGCLHREASQLKAARMSKENLLPPGEAAFNLLYCNYRIKATKRGLPFELTKEQFRVITQSNCIYCDTSPYQIARHKTCHGEYIYNGVDRHVNNEGYTITNALACCGYCNAMKSDRSYEEFLEACRKILGSRERVRSSQTLPREVELVAN